MKIFKVGDRNFPFAGKMYGKEGEYELPDEVAKTFEKEGRGKIIKSLSVDSVPTYLDPPDERFLAQVRRHASQIMQILEEEDKRNGEADRLRFEAENKKDDEKELSNDDSSNTSDTPGDAGQSGNNDVKEPINNENQTSSDEGPKSNNEIKTEASTTTVVEPLPETFPGRDKLIASGIKTVNDIPRNKEGLIKLGIPAKLADQIGVAIQNK